MKKGIVILLLMSVGETYSAAGGGSFLQDRKQSQKAPSLLDQFRQLWQDEDDAIEQALQKDASNNQQKLNDQAAGHGVPTDEDEDDGNPPVHGQQEVVVPQPLKYTRTFPIVLDDQDEDILSPEEMEKQLQDILRHSQIREQESRARDVDIFTRREFLQEPAVAQLVNSRGDESKNEVSFPRAEQGLRILNVSGFLPDKKQILSKYVVSYDVWRQACRSLPLNRQLSLQGCQDVDSEHTPLEEVAKTVEKLVDYSAFLKLQKAIEVQVLPAYEKEHQKKFDIAWAIFSQALFLAKDWYEVNVFDAESSWRNEAPEIGELFIYTQKLVIAPTDKVIMFGDRHGDISSLLDSLDQLHEAKYFEPDSFRLADPATYLIFAGDYTDRGFYGAEVLYTILRLKLENPTRVFLIRGNHETASQTAMQGFKQEANYKFFNTNEFIKNSRYKAIMDFYTYLPAAIYLECQGSILQLCHGGIASAKMGSKYAYEPVELLMKPTTCMYDIAPGLTTGNGLMWSDYDITNEDPRASMTSNTLRGSNECCYANEAMTKEYLEYINRKLQKSGKSLKGFIRAHQHTAYMADKMMLNLLLFRGVYPAWMPDDSEIKMIQAISALTTPTYEQKVADSLVRTLNVSSDSVYGKLCNYAFDAYGILYPKGTSYNEWTMQVQWVFNKPLVKETLQFFITNILDPFPSPRMPNFTSVAYYHMAQVAPYEKFALQLGVESLVKEIYEKGEMKSRQFQQQEQDRLAAIASGPRVEIITTDIDIPMSLEGEISDADMIDSLTPEDILQAFPDRSQTSALASRRSRSGSFDDGTDGDGDMLMADESLDDED